MKSISLNKQYLASFVKEEEIKIHFDKANAINKDLNNLEGTYKGYTGWQILPNEITKEFVEDINKTVNELRKKVEYLLVIGIGGSYLGAKAVISALSNQFAENKVLFAGINLSEQYLIELQDFLKNKKFGICVISKSGTTTEPAVAFRIFNELLNNQVGEKEANTRIIAVTDKSKGALRQLATQKGYKTYVIPDDIGGRFSVLTPVGLVPIAFAGFDIMQLVEGAKANMLTSADNSTYEENIALQYAIIRNILLQKGYLIEILANYNPKMHYIAEWWKQLYGESEGKGGKGIFTASVDFTTDLHSLGQYIQDGPRILFETVLNVQSQPNKIFLGEMEGDLDGLNYLKGKSVEYINQKAFEGTIMAHVEGKVPNIVINIPEISEFTIGQLIYFFEKACGISAMMLDVHPFNQPGVEAYKSNMFKLLGKPTK